MAAQISRKSPAAGLNKMPNWCSNYIQMNSCGENLEEALQVMLDSASELDFEKIIPMPSLLRVVSCGKKTIGGLEVSLWITENGVERILTQSELTEVRRIGFGSWYDWSLVHWGTKWNARNTTLDDSGKAFGTVEIRYDTAYTPPVPILFELETMFPKVNFEFRCRNEDDHEFPHELMKGCLAEQAHNRYAAMVQSEQKQWI